MQGQQNIKISALCLHEFYKSSGLLEQPNTVTGIDKLLCRLLVLFVSPYSQAERQFG
jgi:hypothetical protein